MSDILSSHSIETTRSSMGLRFASIFCLCFAVLSYFPNAFAEGSNVSPVAVAEMKVNINTAGPEDLTLLLVGVGKSKAEAIVAYREKNGNFKSADELKNVRGIGDAILAKNKSRINI